MVAKLVYGDHYIALREFRHYEEDAKGGNPYNTTFVLSVCSGAFRGEGYWECDIREFRAFIEELQKLYTFRGQNACLRDIGYGGNISFSMDHVGHMEISGEIYGNAMKHYLKFCFHADQTVLKDFADALATLENNTVPE